MTIQLAYQQLLLQLFEIYDNREAANISDWVIEHVTGQRKIDRIMFKDIPVGEEQMKRLDEITLELLQHTPVQYVLGEAWFAGMKLYVDENVLVPRPETEELVEWIVEVAGTSKPLSILDVGTGSGCIAITLSKKLAGAEVCGVDLSKGALDVALRNAREQAVDVDLMQLDFLDELAWDQLKTFDVIVSNPPYIKQSEADEMNANVLKHEPHVALFVPNDNALIFYDALAKFGTTHLNKAGSLYMEINESLADEVTALFHQHGYTHVEVRKDLQGKDRMVKASREVA